MGYVVDIAGAEARDGQVGAHGHEFQFITLVSEDVLIDAEIKRRVHHRNHRLGETNPGRRGARPCSQQKPESERDHNIPDGRISTARLDCHAFAVPTTNFGFSQAISAGKSSKPPSMFIVKMISNWAPISA